MNEEGTAAQRDRPDAGSTGAGPPGAPDELGYRLYGVVRGGGLSGLRAAVPDELGRIRYRDLEALVRLVPFGLPSLDAHDVREHQRLVDRVMRRRTILPAPFGVVFRERRTVIRFLRDQYLTLDEGLSFVDGHWELRLHLSPTEPATGDADELELPPDERASRIYSELRRYARAALTFPRREPRLLSAAFLVRSDDWIGFLERVHELGAAQPDLSVDVTGPWPPYDFVRIAG